MSVEWRTLDITHLRLFPTGTVTAVGEGEEFPYVENAKILVDGASVSPQDLVVWFMSQKGSVEADVATDPHSYVQLVSIDFRKKE